MKLLAYIDYSCDELYIPLKNGKILHLGLYVDYPTVFREVDYKSGTPSSVYAYELKNTMGHFLDCIVISDKPKKNMKSIDGLECNEMFDKIFPPLKTVSGVKMNFNFDKKHLITKEGIPIPYEDAMPGYVVGMYLGYVDMVYVYSVNGQLMIADTKKIAIHEGTKYVKCAKKLIKKLKIKHKNDGIPPIDIMD